jgi:hypothetical protein
VAAVSVYDEVTVLVRVIEDDYGNMIDFETFDEYEEWMDEEHAVEEDDGLVPQDTVDVFLDAVARDLSEFFEAPSSLVERLKAAREEYVEVLNEAFDYLVGDE